MCSWVALRSSAKGFGFGTGAMDALNVPSSGAAHLSFVFSTSANYVAKPEDPTTSLQWLTKTSKAAKNTKAPRGSREQGAYTGVHHMVFVLVVLLGAQAFGHGILQLTP